jgi:hypothetical protein
MSFASSSYDKDARIARVILMHIFCRVNAMLQRDYADAMCLPSAYKSMNKK